MKEDPSIIKSRIEPFLTHDLARGVDGCDFIVEAIPEVLDLKIELFNQFGYSPPMDLAEEDFLKLKELAGQIWNENQTDPILGSNRVPIGVEPS